MTLVYAALLGVVQGLTEFLPVSSSAHLILARSFFGWDAEGLGLAFDVACHVGTLLAVVVFFWRDLLAMLAAAVRPLAEDRSAARMRLVVIGTIPVVIVGLTLADLIESRLRTPAVAMVTLAVGAIGLLAAERFGRRTRDQDSIRPWEALALGAAQASALVPGVSRAGATMTVGMLFGLRREDAARFSFVLGVPAILAAAAKEGLDVVQTGIDGHAASLFLVGIASSASVGYLTIKYFLKFLVAHRLDVFAWYRLALAAALAVWLMVR